MQLYCRCLLGVMPFSILVGVRLLVKTVEDLGFTPVKGELLPRHDPEAEEPHSHSHCTPPTTETTLSRVCLPPLPSHFFYKVPVHLDNSSQDAILVCPSSGITRPVLIPRLILRGICAPRRRRSSFFGEEPISLHHFCQ